MLNEDIIKRIVFILSLLCFSSVISSCDVIGDMFEQTESDGNGEEQPSDGEENVQHRDTEIEFDAAGVVDENLLGLCWNMTHERKYEIKGLDNCSWARVRHVQDVDGHDNLVYLTVDPNTTGTARRVAITIKDGNSIICGHIIVQKP